MSKFYIPANNNQYILFGGFVTRDTAVQMVLRELDLPFEFRRVMTRDNEHKSPEFLKLNPSGFIPVLITPEGHILHEAAGMCLWLAEKHKAEFLAPTTDDPDRIKFLNKLFYITNDIQPPSKQFFFAERYSPNQELVQKTKSDAKKRTLERWSVLNDYLSENGPYILGRRPSMVDLYMSMWIAYGLEFNDDISGRFPAVKNLFSLILERPKSGPILQSLQEDVFSYKPSMKDTA